METGIYVAGTLVILGIVFMLIFRRPINQLIDRIRSISKSGISIDSTQKMVTAERDPRAEAEAMIRDLDSALIREFEDEISKDLSGRNLSGDAAVRVLVRYLAVTAINLGFEKTYRVIWGSQLNLLNYLNSLTTGEPAEALRSFYVLASSQYPEWYRGYSFEQWLGYLKGELLLTEDGGRLHITVRGREFLTHLTRMGYTYNKAG